MSVWVDQRDLQHLTGLSIAHYMIGAYTVIVSSIPLIHVCLGLIFLLHPSFNGARGEQVAASRLFGIAFIVIGGGIVAVGWTLGTLTVYAGRCITQRRRHTFCVVVACLNCLHIPIGIILGIFSLIVLTRSSVKPLFQASHPSVTGLA
ncbi:MAG: hypothetical protein ACREDR_13110 [Blastocatellia bacterium]